MPTHIPLTNTLWCGLLLNLTQQMAPTAERSQIIGVVQAIRSLKDGPSPGLAQREIAAVAAVLPHGREHAISQFDAFVECGWLIQVADEVYELAVPQDLYHRPERVVTPIRALTPRCALYRWFDRHGVLLYIGIAYNMKRRDADHAARSPWWTFAVRQSVEWLDDRPKAEVAERKAIGEEGPIFNRAHNRTAEAKQRLVDYLTAQKRTDLLGAAVLEIEEEQAAAAEAA